jgi:hypothetical protein
MSTVKKSPRKSWAHDMERARIESWAQMIDTRPDGMSDFERHQVVTFLRRIARTPAAIEAMITTPRGRGKPSTRESRERADRMALDYALTKERIKLEKSGKANDAAIEVGEVWDAGRTAIMNAYKEPRWKLWGDHDRKRFAIENPNLNGAALLLAHSMELRKSA